MPTSRLDVLIVEDDPAHREAIRRSLKAAFPDLVLREAGSVRDYRRMIEERRPDLALLDLHLPDGRAESVLVSPPEAGAFPQVVMTSHGDEQMAVDAIRSGAMDYVVKSAQAFADLPRTLERAWRAWDLLEEREAAIAALRESERRFRQVTEHVGDWVWETDAEGRYTYSSTVAERIIGFHPDDLVDRMSFFDLVVPEAREEVKSTVLAHFLRREPVVRIRTRQSHRQGHVLTLETSGTPVVDARDRLIGYRGVTSDITVRERTEAQLRSQARLLDLAQDAIAVVDMAGRIRFWNPGCERLTGWPAAESLAEPVQQRLRVSDEEWNRAGRVVRDTGSWSGELHLDTREGRTVAIMSRWTLVRDDAGEPESILLIGTDISEQRALESRLRRAERLESIGALASGIAHDLNNILSPIMMSAPLLREAVTDPDHAAILDTIETCAKRGADITRQLLTFARGTPGTRALVPVRHLVREVDTILRETFPREIRTSVEIAEDLWSVQGDATQILQALINLCLNSRDAMPEGGSLRLRAANARIDEAVASANPGANPGPYLSFTVVDSGTGIAPGDLDHIFDPFFTTKDLGRGTGLGLASVLGIVRGHGGFVRVTSQPGEGTTFELFFPAAAESSPPPPPGAKHSLPRGAGQTVLVVDDEPGVRGSLERTLRQLGYRVLTASHGAEALEVFARHGREIGLVLTDMMMPVMNGPAFARSLRAMNPKVPLLGMTGVPEGKGIRGLDESHLDGMLVKPFSVEELARAIHAAGVGETYPRPAAGVGADGNR